MTETGRVLIVDDDPIVQTIFSSFFACYHIENLRMAMNGKQAIDILSSDIAHIQLIILDINMPEMDGIEVLRHLHSVQYCGKLVICTGSQQTNVESSLSLLKAYGLDYVGLLKKPLTKETLDQVLGPLVGTRAL